MRRRIPCWSAFSAVVAALLLGACGQRGPLYLPDEQKTETSPPAAQQPSEEEDTKKAEPATPQAPQDDAEVKTPPTDPAQPRSSDPPRPDPSFR